MQLDHPWSVRDECHLGRQFVVALSADVERAAGQVSREDATPLHGRAAVPSPFVHWSVDRYSDGAYDLARAPRTVSIAERLVGKAVVALRADYVTGVGLRAPSPWRQVHADHAEHFGDEPAVCLCVPLSARAWPIEFAPYPGRVLLSSTAPDSQRSARFLRDPASRSAAAAVVPLGGILAFDSYAIWRFGLPRDPASSSYLLLHYRGSPYREAKRVAGLQASREPN